MEKITVIMQKKSSPNGVFPFKANREKLGIRLAQVMHINNREFTSHAQKLVTHGSVSIKTTRDEFLFKTHTDEECVS